MATIEPGSLQGILPFVHAVETGSFAGAARRLGVTASAIGKAVALMESRLGVRLLNRTTRSLGLTGEGEAYYRVCVDALTLLDGGQAQLAAQRQLPSGKLRVDLPLAFGRRCVAPVLFDIAKQIPALTFEISFNDRHVDLVREGVDLAVRLGEIGDSSGIAARRLLAQRSVLCAAPSYLDRRGRPDWTSDLDRHDLIVYGRDGGHFPWRVRAGRQPVENYVPRGRLVFGHGEPMLDAALAGCGIALLPTWLAGPDLAAGRLEPLLAMTPVETAEVHAIWPVTRTVAPKIRFVVDTLLERLAPLAREEAGSLN